MNLTDKQKEILAEDGYLLITGGPGSGKTTISILKAERIITEKLKSAQKILFLSFSRAAVNRVVEAIEEADGVEKEKRRRIEVETYHSFFWRIIKSHGYLIGLPKKLKVLTPPEKSVALASIRNEYEDERKLSPELQEEKRAKEDKELTRLAKEEGKVSFDLFDRMTYALIGRSSRIRRSISLAYPYIILDEFQDTNLGQWDVIKMLGANSTLIALADPEQRIYDFIGADPERLDHFTKEYNPKSVDLSQENHRSPGTDIARFGNEILTGKFTQQEYKGVTVKKYEANGNQAYMSLKLSVIEAMKRLTSAGKKDWSVAVLVPTKKLMRTISDDFREKPVLIHNASIDMDGAILAAEIIAFLLEPPRQGDEIEFIDLLCNYFRGKGGGSPSKTDLNESNNILDRFTKARAALDDGKAVPKKSIYHAIHNGFTKAKGLKLSGNPDQDWLKVRSILEDSECPRLQNVALEARNIRLLDRGTTLRELLSNDWRDNGSYPNALQIVRQSFIQEHFSMSGKKETGIVIMNMHKAKGKQFNEVIVFESWPRTFRGQIVANYDRYVRGNKDHEKISGEKQNLRVSVTRARENVTIMTPSNDPCILLP